MKTKVGARWRGGRGVAGGVRRCVTGAVKAGQTGAKTFRAGRAPNRQPCRWITAVCDEFQSIPITFWGIMWRRNQNAACLAGWTVSVYSERGLAGAARAERRALPTQVPSHSQLRLQPLISMNCGSFQ